MKNTALAPHYDPSDADQTPVEHPQDLEQRLADEATEQALIGALPPTRPYTAAESKALTDAVWASLQSHFAVAGKAAA